MENMGFLTDNLPAAPTQRVSHPAIDIGTNLRSTPIDRCPKLMDEPGSREW